MVDKVISSDELATESSLTINPDNIFVVNGFFREPGLIENIAQTFALRGGILKAQEKKDVPVGMIGAIKNLKIFELPRVNTTIHTRVTIEYELLMATLISGRVTQDDNVLAECEMKIFLKEEEKSNISGYEKK